MDEKKMGRRMLDLDELDKVVGGEERRKDFAYQGNGGNHGNHENFDQKTAPADPLSPEQMQAMLDAAMENMNSGKSPVKK